VQILSINVKDNPGRVKSDVEAEKLPYPVLIGRRTGISKEYKISRLPNLTIIDQTGLIHTSKVFMKEDDIRKTLDALIEK
jgi:hypothetical protein